MKDSLHIESILQGCKKQSAAAQEQLYKFCFSDMMKVCLRYHKNLQDAGSSYNAAMAKVFKHIESYRGDGSLFGWIRSIVVNTCIGEIRSRVRFKSIEIDALPADQFLEPESLDVITAKEILGLVQALPSTHTLVFNLHVMEGYAHHEIAEILNISTGTSKWYLHEARKQLKLKIKQHYNHGSYSQIV